METQYYSYKVEIQNTSFTTVEDLKTPKTAIVYFFNKEGDVLRYIEFGYFETRDIYDMIEKGQKINLNYCYVKNFSLTAYRLYTLQDKKAIIEIEGFSAKEAFFDSSFTIDFSYAKFKNPGVTFENAHFASGKVMFNTAEFKEQGPNFAYTFFRDGNADFSRVQFGNGTTEFKNAIFNKGNKDFQYSVFGTGLVSFVNTWFGDGDISFVNVIFGDGETNFKVADFGTGKKDFRFAKFGKGELVFDRTQFGNGMFDFRTVEIKAEKVNFSRSVFGDGDVLFEAIEIKDARINFKSAVFGEGNVSFNLAECDGSKLFFDRTEFGNGSVTFYNSKFKSLSLQSCHLDHYVDLRFSECELLDLSDIIIRDIIDLKPFDFKIKIKSINFAGMRLIGRMYIDWEENQVKSLIESQTNASYAIKAEQFRVLKQNFNVTGRYTDEGKSYVEFKRYESKADLHEAMDKSRWNAVWAYPAFWFKNLVFDKMGLYATAPGRVLISVFAVWFIFGIIYYIFEITGLGKTMSSVGNPDNISVLMQSFYHSAITFFTIGYGDVFPQSISRIFSAIEGFTGVFMMSYFTVAFVRKILR